MSSTIINLIIGFICALFCIWLFRRFFPGKDHTVWRFGLVIAAIIYVIFVLFGEQSEYLVMELGGVMVFSVFAWLSYKYNLYWLSLGWAMHTVWDILLHNAATMTYVPQYYPITCLGFDLAVAAYIAWLAKDYKF